MKKILVLGAGAVGQVYGHCLQVGGAEVGFLVREAYVEATREGADLHRMRWMGGPQSVRFVPDAVFPTSAPPPAEEWDALLLAIPSTGLREPSLAPLIAHFASLPLISLTPGLHDGELLEQARGGGAVTRGLITLVAWPLPLPGDAKGPQAGTAFWFPPLTPSPFEGPDASAIAARLRRGGMGAVLQEGLAQRMAFPTTVLMPFIAVLEEQGWRFARMQAVARARSRAATREAMAAVAAESGARAPLPLRPLPGLLNRPVLGMAQAATPFDLERVLEVHFTKVGAQTTLLLETWLALAERHGLEAPTLASLHAARIAGHPG